MKITVPFASISATSLLIATLAITGCSGSQEDVRVTFCKDLSSSLLYSQENVIWNEGEHKFKRPEYAVVNIQTESADGLTKSACYYKYDAVEDNAMGLSDPFSSYATLPYEVTLNGETVRPSALKNAINAAVTLLSDGVVRDVKKHAEETARQLQNSLN
ncbi:MAG: hypothetical protein JMN24_02295 [gamma proteobacterium endosymbiont of Lamellibrachia anaximandri]|nr:hypothetical protein [gamma proteobacterium endosymbiont of Lamellibrachia anaximandri]MBL3616216.1 hypothetical protein [gamma proteobacterium endosymbiont of Lamellibrachia anaximandri]